MFDLQRRAMWGAAIRETRPHSSDMSKLPALRNVIAHRIMALRPKDFALTSRSEKVA
jgi:hypothetical protein